MGQQMQACSHVETFMHHNMLNAAYIHGDVMENQKPPLCGIHMLLLMVMMCEPCGVLTAKELMFFHCKYIQERCFV